MKGKIIILSAPSGSGKSTIIGKIIERPELKLGFSISATSRNPREGEIHGKDYFFLTPEEFEEKINMGEFIEWEEVYKGTRYGTLESEIRRVTSMGLNLIMDVDVKGALNIKRKYGEEAITIFIMPPNLQTLEQRLRSRATDSDETIIKRLSKAEYEMGFSDQFDRVIINDNLETAVEEAYDTVIDFLSRK